VGNWLAGQALPVPSCARACGSEEGIFFILTRHLRFGWGVAGLLGAGLGSVQLLSDSI